MLKDRAYTFINIFGLTLGISFSLLIFLYISQQLSYDQHIPEAENVYRISSDFRLNGHTDIYSNTPRPMGAALVREYPGITHSVKLVGYNGLQVHEGLLWNGSTYTSSSQAFVVDSSFFEVFQLPLLEGDPATALKEPNTIVVASSIAENLFGYESAIGKTIKLEGNQEALVTGVFADITDPTHLPFDVLISYQTYFSKSNIEQQWYGGHVYTYVRTIPEFEPSDVNDHWLPFFEKYMKETFDILNGTGQIIFQPITDLYLAPEHIWEPYAHGSLQNIYIFSIIGIILIIVACFNYTNLTLSRSLARGKEVGVRKTLGANKNNLRLQFIGESIFISLVAAFISISFIAAILPTFNGLIEQNLALNYFEQPTNLLILLGIGLVIGIIAGLYPAFHIASFKTSSALKGLNKSKGGEFNVRKSLVVLQQIISIVLIICTLVVLDQVTYLRNMDIGFDKNNLVLINVRDTVIRNRLDVFQQDLKAIPDIMEITRMQDTPGTGINDFNYEVENFKGEFQSTPTQILQVGLNFINTMGIKLIAGSVFNENDDNYKSVIINRLQAKKLGYEPNEAIGARFQFPDDDGTERKVIGVVEDFMLGSANDPLKSQTISYATYNRRYLAIRIKSENQQAALASIEKLWTSYGSTFPFNYSFMDEQLESLLGKETRLYNLLIFGSMLIIFISCLGLFGLISCTTLQRKKEIGMRKVLGAKTITLFYIVISDFLRSSAVAFFIAIVIAWYVGKGWLDNFAIRTDFDWSNVAIAGVLSLMITVLTLSYHTLVVIKANPVDSIKEQ